MGQANHTPWYSRARRRDGTPELYFMHFWVVGTPEQVAAGLRAAVDVLKQ